MKSNKFINRRTLAHITLGVVASAALAACGGGGGGDSSNVNLREAFDEIQYKITKDEVRTVVGRHEDNESNYKWNEGGEELWVFGGNSAIAVR